jgi:hypothetical protein
MGRMAEGTRRIIDLGFLTTLAILLIRGAAIPLFEYMPRGPPIHIFTAGSLTPLKRRLNNFPGDWIPELFEVFLAQFSHSVAIITYLCDLVQEHQSVEERENEKVIFCECTLSNRKEEGFPKRICDKKGAILGISQRKNNFIGTTDYLKKKNKIKRGDTCRSVALSGETSFHIYFF